jgi:hypothetical protein
MAFLRIWPYRHTDGLTSLSFVSHDAWSGWMKTAADVYSLVVDVSTYAKALAGKCLTNIAYKQERANITPVVKSTVVALLCCLSSSSHAQTVVYNISNIPGTGKDIDHAALPNTLGSARLTSGGSNPLANSPHRGWFGIEAPTTLTVSEGPVTVSWSQYLVGIVSNSTGGTVGTTFDLTSTTLEVADFSFAVFNPSTNMLEPAFPGLLSEPNFGSSSLSITKTSDFVLSAEGFGNSRVPFYRYEFSATYNNPQTFTANWVGVTYSAVLNGSGQRVYAAAFTGAEGRYSEKIGIMQPRVETPLVNGPGLGVTIQIIGSGGGAASAPEPGTLSFLLLAAPTALALRKRGSALKRGKR